MLSQFIRFEQTAIIQLFITHRALPTTPLCLIFIYAETIIKIASERVILRPCPQILLDVRTDCQVLKNILVNLVEALNTH